MLTRDRIVYCQPATHRLISGEVDPASLGVAAGDTAPGQQSNTASAQKNDVEPQSGLGSTPRSVPPTGQATAPGSDTVGVSSMPVVGMQASTREPSTEEAIPTAAAVPSSLVQQNDAFSGTRYTSMW